MKKRMKRYKKTYAIYHLTEKHTVFYLGKTKVHVSFMGGIVTKKGVTPATFTTDDPIVQLAIENSGDFRKGAIKLAGQYALGGEVVIGGNPGAPEAAQGAPSAQVVEAPQAAPTELREPEGEADSACGGGEAAGADCEEAAGAAELEEVEVSCKDVAKQYLQEHFNENPTPLRTIALVQECAAKYGIVFKFV